MSDWTNYLGRSRRWMESLAWVGAAALVMLVLATSAALAMWFDKRAGQGQAETIIIDLPPMEAFEEAGDPGEQPETRPDAPDAPDAPDIDDRPPTPETAAEDLPEFEQPEIPELDQVAEEVPDTSLPPPQPEPEPVEKAEVEKPKVQAKPQEKMRQKKAKKDEKNKEAAGRKSDASEAANAGGASARGSNATADADKLWQSKVSALLGRHMKRGAYGGRGTIGLNFSLNASGTVASASLSGSTGDAAADAKILSRVRSFKTPPPDPGRKRNFSLLVTIER